MFMYQKGSLALHRVAEKSYNTLEITYSTTGYRTAVLGKLDIG